MFVPGHARLNIHFVWAGERENLSSRFTTKYDTNRPAQLLLKFRNYKYCYIQVVNRNGADQTARISRQVDTFKFVVRK